MSMPHRPESMNRKFACNPQYNFCARKQSSNDEKHYGKPSTKFLIVRKNHWKDRILIASNMALFIQPADKCSPTLIKVQRGHLTPPTPSSGQENDWHPDPEMIALLRYSQFTII